MSMMEPRPQLKRIGQADKFQILYRVKGDEVWHLSSGFYETAQAFTDEAPKNLVFTGVKCLQRSKKSWETYECTFCGAICKPDEDHTYVNCANKMKELLKEAKQLLTEDVAITNFKTKHRAMLRGNEAFRHLQSKGSERDPIWFEDVEMCFEQLYYSTIVHPEPDLRNTPIEFIGHTGEKIFGTVYEMCLDRIIKK